MRKLLLATTALIGVALAGAAQAAPASPISLNVGGYTDFVAGFYHEAPSTTPGTGDRRTGHDFETEFKLNFDAVGKASNGIEYGANVSLWNGAEVNNLWAGNGQSVVVNSAYVWMSGSFGKVLFGDEHGASDLFVYAPTVGEGQVDGRYSDFVDLSTLAHFQPAGIDNTEHSTKITYYTPKVGNENNKVQLGVSYVPNLYDYGQGAVLYKGTTTAGNSAYQDVVKAALAYTGNIRPVTVAASAQLITGFSSHAPLGSTVLGGSTATTSVTPAGKAQDFTAWGLGAQAGYNGFTVGGSYTDLGRYNTAHGQNREQDVWTVGGKYEFDKVGVALNYLSGQGYANYLDTAGSANTAATANGMNYVSGFDAYGAGATYTWFPGLTSAIDGVMFSQQANQVEHNDGYVVLVSQKLAF